MIVRARAWYDPVKDAFHLLLYRRSYGSEEVASGVFNQEIEWEMSEGGTRSTETFLTIGIDEAKALSRALMEEIKRVEAEQDVHQGGSQEVRRLVLPSPGEYEGSSLRGSDVVGGVQRDGESSEP